MANMTFVNSFPIHNFPGAK